MTAARGRDERPFCMVVSLTHPHDPFAIPERYWNLYRDEDIELPKVGPADWTPDPHSRRLRHVCDMDNAEITEAHVRNARRAYYGAISYVDDNVGRLMAALRATNLADDTVVIVTSDHGEMLGERGFWYKMSFFEGAARVPLIVHAPKHFAPRRVANAVSLVDMLPTLVELANDGRSGDYAAPLDGRSLLPHLAGGDGHDEVIGEYLAEGAIAPLVMIRRGPWKFVHSPADPDQLYNLADDPLELANLAEAPAASDALASFRAEAAGRWDFAGARPGGAREPAPAPLRQCRARHRHARALGLSAVPRRQHAIHPQPRRPRRSRGHGPLSAGAADRYLSRISDWTHEGDGNVEDAATPALHVRFGAPAGHAAVHRTAPQPRSRRPAPRCACPIRAGPTSPRPMPSPACCWKRSATSRRSRRWRFRSPSKH